MYADREGQARQGRHDSDSGDSHRDWKQDRLRFQARLPAEEAYQKESRLPAEEAHQKESYHRCSPRTKKTRKRAIKSKGAVTDSLVTRNSTSEAAHHDPHPLDITAVGPAWAASLKPRSASLQDQHAALDEDSPALFNSWGLKSAPKPHSITETQPLISANREAKTTDSALQAAGKTRQARLVSLPGTESSPEENFFDSLGAGFDDQTADHANERHHSNEWQTMPTKDTPAMNGNTGDTASAGNPFAGWHEVFDAVLPAEAPSPPAAVCAYCDERLQGVHDLERHLEQPAHVQRVSGTVLPWAAGLAPSLAHTWPFFCNTCRVSLRSHDDLDQHLSGAEHGRRALLFEHPGGCRQSLKIVDIVTGSHTESLSLLKNGKEMLRIKASSYVKNNGLCSSN